MSNLPLPEHTLNQHGCSTPSWVIVLAKCIQCGGTVGIYLRLTYMIDCIFEWMDTKCLASLHLGIHSKLKSKLNFQNPISLHSSWNTSKKGIQIGKWQIIKSSILLGLGFLSSWCNVNVETLLLLYYWYYCARGSE